MQFVACCTIALACWTQTASAQPSTGARVDGLVAIVGGRVPGPEVEIVLRSDVELRARLRLAGEDPSTPVSEQRTTPAMAETTRDELIGEALIVREARRVGVAAPSPAEIEREVQRLEDLSGGRARMNEVLQTLGARREEVVASATRRAQVGAFLQANLASTIVPSDAQIERAYQAGDHPFTAEPLESVREALRTWLARRAVERAVRRWVEVLGTRTDVRRIGSF